MKHPFFLIKIKGRLHRHLFLDLAPAALAPPPRRPPAGGQPGRHGGAQAAEGHGRMRKVAVLRGGGG